MHHLFSEIFTFSKKYAPGPKHKKTQTKNKTKTKSTKHKATINEQKAKSKHQKAKCKQQKVKSKKQKANSKKQQAKSKNHTKAKVQPPEGRSSSSSSRVSPKTCTPTANPPLILRACARTHERNETISRLGSHKGLGPPTSDLQAAFFVYEQTD